MALFVSQAILAGSGADAGDRRPDEPVSAIPAASWVRVTSPHFVYLSNAGETPTREIARSLETLRTVLSRIGKGLELDGGRPTLVYVFRDPETFGPYRRLNGKAVETLGGYFLSGPDMDIIAIDASAGSFAAIYHEYLHQVMARSFEHLPLWLEEGIADFYSTFECDEKEARIGRPDRQYVDWLRENPPLAINDLLAVDRQSKDYNEDSRRGRFYATSWLLAHYLLMGNDVRKPQLVRFLETLRTMPIEQAFSTSFETDFAGMTSELRSYAGRDSFVYVKWDAKDVTTVVVAGAQTLDKLEQAAQLGSLLARVTPPDSTEAEAALKAVLATDPGQPTALAALGFLSIRREKFKEAEQFYRLALERKPDDQRLLALLGRSMMVQGMGGSGRAYEPPESAETTTKARKVLSRALNIDPDDAETLWIYGLTWLRQNRTGEDLTPGIAALEKAMKRLPRRSDILVALIGLYGLKGDRKRVEDLISRRLAIVGGAREMTIAREVLLDLDMKEAFGLADEKQYDTALAILNKARVETVSSDRKAFLEGVIPKMEAEAEWFREAALYQEAIQRVRKGDLSGAAAKLTVLLKDCKHPEICPSARKSLQELLQSGARP